MVNTIFLIEPPCVGKTTLGLQLQEQFGFKLIQMSEILRQNNLNTNGGNLIPSHIIYEILKQKLCSLASKEIAIIDGFPRTMESVLQWGICEYPPICVIYFDCHSQNLKFRSMERLKLAARGDDTEKIIEKTPNTFNRYIRDIINFYTDRELLYCVDANQNKNEVLNKVCMILAREFQAKNIFTDQIILSQTNRFSKNDLAVIEKGVEKLTSSKDQERINNSTLSVSRILCFSH